MDTDTLHGMLAGLTGHLTARSPHDESQIQRLHQFLSRSLLPSDLEQLKGGSFTFENADLFAPERVSPDRLAALESVARASSAEGAVPEFRVFARDVPVRSTQLPASVPLWAGGAAVDNTIGPLLNKDGRRLWFDFYRIERLVALYVQGDADPVLLFNVRAPRFISRALPPVTDLAPSYQLGAGSIWVNSRLLTAAAPTGYFTGLTIKSGTITLSAAPQLLNGKLTLAPNTTVTVDLQLQQPAVQGADPSSPYGIDARNATLQLPAQFAFHFSGQGRTFDKISSAQWQVYGQAESFEWKQQAQPTYDALLHRVLIPFNYSQPDLHVTDCQSPFQQVQGSAPITAAAWALPAAPIDVLNPTAAAGIGGMLVRCGSGLSSTWTGLKGGSVNLGQPYVMADPGRISITDLAAGNIYCSQLLNLWKDDINPFGSSVKLQYLAAGPLFYNTLASGVEALMTLANADVEIDRPVTAVGEALAIRSKNSVLFLAVSKTLKLVYLFDDNILFDSTDLNAKPPVIPQPIALALHNALFKVTPVNGCLLAGELPGDGVQVRPGFLFLTFGLLAYLPTLPDPYAANVGPLKYQFRGDRGRFASDAGFSGQAIRMWLVCQVQWQAGAGDKDTVTVSFHFAPLQNQFQLMASGQAAGAESVSTNAVQSPDLCETLLTPLKEPPTRPAAGVERAQPAADVVAAPRAAETMPALQPGAGEPGRIALKTEMAISSELPDYEREWNDATQCLRDELFALLDVSTNADLLGVSFNGFGGRRLEMVRTFAVAPGAGTFPLQVEGLDVVSSGHNVRAFTVPEISWEPVLNTAPQVIPGDPPGHAPNVAEGVVPNYYPDDGGPTRIFNNSVHLVPLAPIPLSQFIVDQYNKDKLSITSSLFTLPFGMRALAVLNRFLYPEPPSIQFNRPKFENQLKGGLQLRLDAGKLPTDEYPMFNGGTLQINNVLDLNGNPTAAGTLGYSVGYIFNQEFRPKVSPSILVSRGVPLTRVDFSGYGASMFSNWFNPLAQMAQTSQSRFDVWVGRTAHEVVQVKSIIYPWGIRVVRTIILYRAATGYEYRVDTGWKPQSDGRFDFSYYMKDGSNLLGLFPDYAVHPGVLSGLFDVKNIVEVDNQFATKSIIHKNEYYLDENNFVKQNTTGADMQVDALLQMVTFDANAEIEDVVQGQVNGRVPSKGIMGFVQLAPRGIPLSQEAFKALLDYQPQPIGGPVDCIVDVGRTGQTIRLNRFDVSNSLGANGTDTVFAAAVRGSVVLPQDGSWSMVQHRRGTGEVTPLPQQLSVPLIRVGQLTYQLDQVDPNTQHVLLKPDPNASKNVQRIADPLELLRAPAGDTLNYGFLFSTDTQKALFLTPAYPSMTGAPTSPFPKLLSKTPPLFADAFRIVNSSAIFPNVGDAETNLGDAISLYSQGTEFVQNALTDGGKQVLELMQINQTAGGVVQQGYKLLKQFPTFTLPSGSWTLIEIGGAFKIYIEYKASNIPTKNGPPKSLPGALDFDVNSFAGMADRWKSLMQDVSLVVDLGPISRLMTIKGNWNSQNGAEAQYKGSDTDADLPSPQIEFAPELQPVIEILQILQDLQTGDYKDAFQQGLKLAMSNKAGSWEYKLEASKEIPVVRFPTPDELYNNPNAPFKLEAGLKLGAYFNAALKVTTDPKQLLPTAGGYLGFYGRLSVMCVSLSIATIYAVGQVNLDIGADTKVGPSLDMKFGFGAQIVVGLPVVGNVSVLYMVGVEIYIDSTKLNLSAFMLFQGQAELLGGIVGVTITIEAKGTVSRTSERTDLAAQVTFGLDISIFLVIDISFSTSWQEQRQIA